VTKSEKERYEQEEEEEETDRGGRQRRIMRVSTQRARMKARVFSGEGQRIGHEGDAHADE